MDVGIGAVPAVLYFLLLYFIPQLSPRWLALKNRDEEAKKTLISIGGEEYATQVFKEIKKISEDLKNIPGISFREVFKKKMTLILIIGLGIAFLSTNYRDKCYFLLCTNDLRMAGGGQDAAFAQAIILGLTNVIFTVVAMFLIDRLGQKAPFDHWVNRDYDIPFDCRVCF